LPCLRAGGCGRDRHLVGGGHCGGDVVREAAAEIGTLSVEATVAETLSGLATIYLAAEAFFRPIWGRYFTTEYPPDRSTPSLPRLI